MWSRGGELRQPGEDLAGLASSRATRASRPAAAWVLTTVLAIAAATLTGCDDDPAPSGGGDATHTPDASSTGASGQPSPTNDTGSSVTPAAGQLVKQKAFRFRLFESAGQWGTTQTGSTLTASVRTEYGSFIINANALTSTPFTPDEGAEAALTVRTSMGLRLRRGADRTVNGADCFVLSGKKDGRLLYYVGAYNAGFDILFEFEAPADEPGVRDKMEAIIASIEWT